MDVQTIGKEWFGRRICWGSWHPTGSSQHFSLHLRHEIRSAILLRGEPHSEGWNMRKDRRTRKDIPSSPTSFLCHVVSAIEGTVRWKTLILGSKQQRIWEPGPQDSSELWRIGSLPRTRVLLCQPGVSCGPPRFDIHLDQEPLCGSCPRDLFLFSSFLSPLLFQVNNPPPPTACCCHPGFPPLSITGGMAEVKFTISFIDCKKVGSHPGTGSHRTRRGMHSAWILWLLWPANDLSSSLTTLTDSDWGEECDFTFWWGDEWFIVVNDCKVDL